MIIFLKRHAKEAVSLIILLVITVSFVFFNVKQEEIFSDMEKASVSLGGVEIMAWVADTDLLRNRGLGGIESLELNEGMLFIFDKPGFFGFWMNGMVIPIDIIWLDNNFKIVYIEKSVSPDTFPKTFFPKQVARYVLETKSGFTADFGVSIGDKVSVEFLSDATE